MPINLGTNLHAHVNALGDYRSSSKHSLSTLRLLLSNKCDPNIDPRTITLNSSDDTDIRAVARDLQFVPRVLSIAANHRAGIDTIRMDVKYAKQRSGTLPCTFYIMNLARSPERSCSASFKLR